MWFQVMASFSWLPQGARKYRSHMESFLSGRQMDEFCISCSSSDWPLGQLGVRGGGGGGFVPKLLAGKQLLLSKGNSVNKKVNGSLR